MSWQKVKLGSILTESKVISDNPDTNKRIKVRLKVLGVEKRGVENEVEGATKQFIRRAGQFIFGKQNFHKGAFGIIPEELDGFESSSDLPSFDIDKSCLPEFLFYFFKQGNYYLELSKIAYGVATQRINMKEFYELEIPLPDIEIQKQIINQFKTLENSGGEISDELTHQLDLIKQLRQAFLREAMQGKLVDGSKLMVDSAETGRELLAKIKAEKAQLITDKKLKKEKELPPITDDEIPFEIPEHWAWSMLGEIIYNTEGGKSPNCLHEPAKENEWGVIKTTAVQEMVFLQNENKVLPNNFTVSEQHKIFEGDVLITRAGPKNRVGIVCCVENLISNLILSDKTIRINFSKSLIQSKFLALSLNSPMIKPFIERKMTGMADSQVNISQDNMKGFPIPLPPLHEQEQIVAKLEELMAFCDGLEQSIKESQGYNEQLLQQVLREALQSNN
jgi:type I restriction enzyme S subunit